MDTFDFDKTGKRMPYRVPDGFFDAMEERLLSAAAPPVPRRRFAPLAICRTLAAAATLALIVVSVKTGIYAAPTDFDDVARAYDRLAEDDREYLADIYQDDLFINQITEQQ